MRTSVKVVAVAAGLALSLTACGRGTDSGGADKAKAVSEGKAKGTITVWAMGTEGEALQKFVKPFEKANPGAHVKVTAVPWDAAHDKISTAISSGKTPDASLIGTTWMGEFAKADGLDPTPKSLFKSDSFFSGTWDSTVVNGTSYGVPWYADTRVLYYRTDLAKKAGFSQPPTTWAELSRFGKALKSKAGVKTPVYVQPGQTGSWQTMLPFSWSAGAKLTGSGDKSYTLDTPAMRKGLDFYRSLFTDKLSTQVLPDPGVVESSFAKGTEGSFISGPWEIGLLKDAGLDTSKYAVAPLPGQSGGNGTSFVGGGDMSVFKSAKNRDGAWKLLQWLTKPDVQAKWYETVGDLPAVQGSWQSGTLANDPKLKVFGQQLEHASSPPATPTWEQVAAVIDSDVEKVVKGTMSVADAVKDMQQQASSIGTGL
ncbi:MAG: sugar ABC transporter substrate-binding protein [Actinocatenispora sp.]